jgi:radical SAM superfamily enzyme YgiQ (UPF0313 family)
MKQIMLIMPKTRNPFWRPLNLEYVAEALIEAGYGVHLLDLTVANTPESTVKEWIASNYYDAVGVSIFNTQWDTGRDCVYFCLPDIRDMISDIRTMTKAPVILGGYGFSMQPEDILEYVGGDFGVAGCGTRALPDLLERIKHNSIDTGTVVGEQLRKYLDMEFKRNTANSDRYPENETVYVGAHEGCISNCYHCPFGSDKMRMRFREPSKIIAEVHNLITQGVKRIKLVSCMINISVEYTRRLCEGLTKLPIEWSANIFPSPKYLPVDLANAMKRSGMFQAGVGSRVIGSDRMLRVYRQEFDTRDIAYATRLFNEREIETSWFTGFGAPGECKETIDETFNLIDSTKVDHAEIITKARIYRNAELFNIALSEGLVSPDDKLLEPTYYPFADELRDYIWEEAGKRENCSVYY